MSFSIKLDQDTHITLPFSIRMTAIEFGRHWNLVKEYRPLIFGLQLNESIVKGQ